MTPPRTPGQVAREAFLDRSQGYLASVSNPSEAWEAAAQAVLADANQRIDQLETELAGIMSSSTGVMLEESLQREAAANQRIAELEAERAQALTHAQNLLRCILNNHYSKVATLEFIISDNLLGVLNQIDNALTRYIKNHDGVIPLPEQPSALEKEIKSVLNNRSAENGSNTPDFILAKYLMDCLAAWNQGVSARDKHYHSDKAEA
jgi:hypothetical protein